MQAWQTNSIPVAIKRFKKYARQIRRLQQSSDRSVAMRRKTRFLHKRLEQLRRIINPLVNARTAAILTAIMAGLTVPLQAQPKVTALAPATNASQVLRSATIDITFSEAMNAASIDADNILIFGSQAGYLSTKGTFSGNPALSFNPDDSFFPNELISVSVTNAQSSGLTPIDRALVYQFRARTPQGSGVFASSGIGVFNAYAVATADLDGDGDLDAVLALQAGLANRILLNNGNATFSSSSLGAGNSEVVAFGDLDNDGDVDVIIGNDSGQANEIWLNNGDASFSTSTFGGGNTRGLTITDLDGDGDLDAMNANYGGNPTRWLNNGDATFVSSNLGSSNSFQGVDHGDFDNDGDMDLIFAVNNDPHEIWLNNGNATFSISTLGTGSSTDVSVGDLDNDGNLDAIVANNFGQAVDILLGNGDGSFAASTIGGFDGQDVMLGDIDGDGDLDAVIANNDAGQGILVNNGDGTFISSAFNTRSMRGGTLGDLDGDGDLDALMVTNNGNSERWINQDRPSALGEDPTRNDGHIALDSDIQIGFTESMNTASLTTTPFNTASIRVFASERGQISTNAGISFSNGNQRATLNPVNNFRAGELISVSVTSAITSAAGLQATSGTVYQFRATSAIASATFSNVNTISGSTFGVSLGDLDNDGNLDAILSFFSASPAILLGNGDGTFSDSTFGPSAQTDGNALGDLDGDGDLDVIIARVNSARDIWLNNGDGTFTSTAFDGGNNVSAVEIADLDGDGDLDVVFAGSGSSRERLWLNNGDATFTSSTFGDTQNSQALVLGDIDNDGDLDLVVGNYGAEGIHLNNGDATFVRTSFGSGNTLGMDIGDLNNDGNLDIVLARNGASSSIWLGNGDGTFASSALGASGSRDAVVGDLDGDGDEDIVMFRNGAEEVWINDGTANFVSSAFGGGGSIAGAMGDIDGDGDLDVYVGNYLNTVDNVWLNLPPAPTITNVNPNSTTASLSAMNLKVTGEFFESTQASLTFLSASGATLGSNSLSLFSSSATSFVAGLPAAAVSTAGTLTLSVTTAGGSTSASFTVTNDQPTIAAVDPTPTFPEDGSTTISLTIGDVWPGLAALSIIPPATDGSTIASITQVGATMATTQFQIAGATNANGIVPLTFTVDDGFLQSTTTINVNIIPQPDAPTLEPLAKVTLWQNGVSGANLLIGDVDTPFGALTVTATSANQALISDGNIILGATGATTSLDFAAECDVAGDTQIFVTVSDGVGTTSQTIEVCINPISEAPINGSTIACVGSISQYDALPATTGASLLWSAVGGTILAGQGTSEIDVQWQNSTNQSLTLLRSYPNGCTSASTINLNVSFLDALTDFAAPASATSVTLAVLSNDAGAGLSITGLSNPVNGSASFSGAIVTYTPDAGFAGLESFEYTVENAAGCSVTGAVLVAVPEAAARVNLKLVDRYVNRDGAIRGLQGANAAAVSPDGKHTYVAGYFDHSIAVFERDTADGSLTYQSRVRNLSGGVSGLKFVHDIKLSPDGRWLFAVGYGDNSLVVFARNQATGALTFLDKRKHGQTDSGGKITGLKRPRALAISADATSIYVAANAINSLGVFAFDNISGQLQWVERQKDGINGVDGLRRVLDVAVSPDGKNVYAAGFGEHEIAMFGRDVSSGELSYLGRMRDGFNGIDGLNGVAALSHSPAGENLYAAGIYDDAVAVFDRDVSSGLLTFVERWKDGLDGVEGLDGARDVTASRGGRQVWATGPSDNAVVIFTRNDDGSLEYADQMASDVDDARSVAVSGDSRYGYTAANDADVATAIFRNRQPEAGADVGLNVVKNSTLVVNVLDNDSDADNHTLTITGKTNGALGTVGITGGGTTVTYNAGATTGADQFSYTIEDGFGGSSTATVSIAVNNAKSSVAEAGASDFQAETSRLAVSPNPLRDRMTIECQLDQAARLEFVLIDMRGAEVAALNAGDFAAGQHSIDWNLADRGLAAGAYTLVLRSAAEGSKVQGFEVSVAVRIFD